MTKRKSTEQLNNKEIDNLHELDEQEEEEFEGFEDESDDNDDEIQQKSTVNGKNTQGLKLKKKLKATHLADELRNIQEAVQLYKSNIFKLEIDELLKELRVDENKTKPVDKILHQIKEIVENIEPTEEMLLPEAEELISKTGISIPFPDPKPQPDVQYRFKYDKPADFNLVGQYSLKTMIKTPQKFAIDVVVTMPDQIFHDKDILNYRYFHKRAFYLAFLASSLQKNEDLSLKISYEYLDGDHLRPVLRLDPINDGTKTELHKAKCYIRIIPGITNSVFSHNKLSGSRNCIRYDQAPVDSLKPTPYYNSSILSDTQLFDNTVFLHKAAKSSDSFRDACKLGEIWLRQRGFSSSVDGGGIGAWEFSILIATLLVGGGSHGSRVLSKGFSNYQLFKATLNFISLNDFTEYAVTMGNEAVDTEGFDGLPVLLNNAVGLNTLWKTSSYSYERLRHEASLTVKELDDIKGDHFDSVFLDRVDSIVYQYDLTASLKFSKSQSDKAYRELERVFSPSYYAYFTSKVYRVLKTGLGERAALVSVKFKESSQWDLTDRKPSLIGEPSFTIGLILNPEHSEQQVTHGPSAEDKSAADSFRNFWGSKSELRRFKDGSITESVVWTTQPDRSVVGQIMTYLIGRHLGESVAASITFVADGLNRLFMDDPQLGEGNAFGNFQKALNAFETLRKMLIDIDDLPLRVSTVMPASQILRYASIQTPAEFQVKSVHDFADVVIELETSSKWPEDLKAVQHSKAAFLLGIGKSLEAADASIIVRPGLGRDLDTIENFAHLDVLFANGYAFRVRITTEREASMLKNYKQDKDLGQRTLRKLERKLTLAARHTTEFQTLCHRFPFLSPTVRRVKKWFHSHYLSPHVDDILIELLTLTVFLRPFPWTPPANATIGFLRTLYLLAHWDWRSDPLILDIDSSLNIHEIQEIRDSFKSLRTHDPEFSQVAMFVAVNYERSGTLWTSPGPSKVIASRITALARASCEVVKSAISDKLTESAAFERIFATPLQDFDFVLHLNDLTAANSLIAYPPQADLLCDAVGLYFAELQTVFNDNVLLFRDNTSNDAIAGVWDPKVLEPKNWKVYLGYSSRPDKDGKVKANVQAMVREMARLGGDLVADVEIYREG
ncbi:Nrap protein [Lipomyces arxii]|uniref:Nrap protein n=1 Tax=Lipomyces arxii TaxID=56418 RepID=UPI0034CDECA0